MWDAQQQYWYGYEWTKNLVGNTGQPTLNNGSSSNYAQSNSDVSRWYHEGGGSGRLDATHTSCKDLPNVNEMTWYCKYGDPRWDADELWTTMGHLYKGGMWFKKKSVLKADHHYDTEKSVDGTDWRTNDSSGDSWAAFQTLPSTADAGKYFYLPALGGYGSGQLFGVGIAGYYWSSSARSGNSNSTYALSFHHDRANVGDCSRSYGLRVGGFE